MASEKHATTNPNDIKINGGLKSTLCGSITVGAMGLATAVLLTNTLNHLKDHMPLLASGVLAGIFIGIPSMAGAILRIPGALVLERFSTRKVHLTIMLMSLVGLVILMATAFITEKREFNQATNQTNQTDFKELGVGVYCAYLFGGVIGGLDLALFAVGSTTVAFWASQSQQGAALGIYGGITNVAPGLMNMWLGPSMKSTSLGITYMIWLILFFASMPFVYFIRDSPYHQMMFHKKKEMKKLGREMTSKENQQLKDNAHAHFGQDVFPIGDIRKTLKQAALSMRTWALCYLYIMSFGGFLAFTVYLPTFWKNAFHKTTSVAGYLGGMYAIIAALSRTPFGILCDYFHKYMQIFVHIGGNILVIIGCLILAFSQSFSICMFGTILMAFGTGASKAACYKMMPKLAKKHLAGTSGFVAGIGASGGFFWPLLMGAIDGSFGLHWSFLLLCGMNVTAIGVTLGVWKVLVKDDRHDRKMNDDAMQMGMEMEKANIDQKMKTMNDGKVLVGQQTIVEEKTLPMLVLKF